MKCPDCGKTGIKAKVLQFHRAGHKRLGNKKTTHAIEANGHGFREAVAAEIKRIELEMADLTIRRNLLEGLK